MKEFLITNSLWIAAIAPILISIVTYVLGMKIVQNKWKVIHMTVQWTAVFYIAAVVLLFKSIFNIQLLGYILIGSIIILAMLLINQWKKDNEVILLKGLQVMWRICFLIFSTIHVGFIIYLLINYAIL